NKWKLRFNRGHFYQGYDQYGNAWPEKFRTINFGTAASPWVSPNRGMAGMDEALAFKLFNTVGVAAPNIAPFQFRVIDNAVEAHPSNQYEGDLWGLYLAFENPSGPFLDAHDLPDGNLYRFGPIELENQGPGLPSSTTFVTNFVTAYNQPHTVSWWRDNVDVEGYYSYRSIVETVNHSDLVEMHNMLLFYNPETGKWSQLPWDVDLLYEEYDRWGPNGVQQTIPLEPFRRMLARQELNIEFQARARELQDLLLNQDQGWQMIEEYARYVEPFADVDRDMWNYNPRTVGAHIGAFYKEVRNYDNNASGVSRTISPASFEGMINWVKEFTTLGGFGGNQLEVLYADAAIPDTPTINYLGGVGYPIDDLTFQTSSFSDPQGNGSFGAMEWRVGEISDPAAPSYDAAVPTIYEINAIWESGELAGFGDQMTVPADSIEVGHAYRARVRMKDDSGRWSHWSEPIQLIAGEAIGPAADGLRITEIMYHPAGPTADELAVDATFTADDFEF
ncbi:hypothetical protein LCGC14_2486880, partial [marine sediment metagenome]